MTSKGFKVNQDIQVPLSLFISVTIFITYFIGVYILYGHDGLPIGWDTPHYISQIKQISSQGILFFLQSNDYYNIGYALIASIPCILGFPVYTVEMIFPIVIATSTIIISVQLVERYLKNTKITAFMALLLIGWFTSYRLTVDLHSNILSFFEYAE